MSTNINNGSQTLCFDYRYPAKGRDFNILNRDVLRAGIYKGLTLSFSGNNVFVSSGKAIINCLFGNKDALAIKIDFDSLYAYGTILPSQFGENEVLYLEYEYGEIVENYAEFKKESMASFLLSPKPNAVILGEITFDEFNQITGIDYSRKTWGSINADADWTIPDQLYYHDTDDYDKRWRIKGTYLPTGFRDLEFQSFSESEARIPITNGDNTAEIENNLNVVNRLTVGKFDGRVPLGGVIDIPPLFSGANNTGIAEEFPGIPSSGVITDDGFMLFDGSEIPIGANPDLVGKYTPNVSDDRFLMGALGITTNPISTDTGVNNGDNSVTLTLDQIPAHNHGGGDHRHQVDGDGVLYAMTYNRGPSTNGLRGGIDSDDPGSFKYNFNTAFSGNIIDTQGGGQSFDVRPKWMKVKRLGRVR